jgi:hypothetical protein
MVVGSFAWGWLGDRIGRRASILLAGLTFIATSIIEYGPKPRGAQPTEQARLSTDEADPDDIPF